LTKDIVDSGRANIVFNESDAVIKHLRVLSKALGFDELTYDARSRFNYGINRRKLLETRRNDQDYFIARALYDEARGELHVVLDIWKKERTKQVEESRQVLARASAVTLQKACESINQAIEATLQNWKLGVVQLEDIVRRGPQASPGEKEVGNLNEL
jgi:hypothetical protein